MPDLELGELDEELFTKGTLAKLSKGTLIVEPRVSVVTLVLLKISRFDIAGGDWVRVDESLKDAATPINLPETLLEFQKSVPGVLCWLPGHPVFENSSCALNLAKHLFHESILVPELVHSWHVLTGTLPHVPSRVDKLVPHLHLSVLKPQSHVLEVHADCSFENGASPTEFTDAGLPLSILKPSAHVVFLHTEGVFEILAHAVLVVVKLIRVGDAHLGRLVLIQLVLNRLPD